jgi:hypothetical protein
MIQVLYTVGDCEVAITPVQGLNRRWRCFFVLTLSNDLTIPRFSHHLHSEYREAQEAVKAGQDFADMYAAIGCPPLIPPPRAIVLRLTKH